jgi:type IV pilus assembly protein PilQ
MIRSSFFKIVLLLAAALILFQRPLNAKEDPTAKPASTEDAAATRRLVSKEDDAKTADKGSPPAQAKAEPADNTPQPAAQGNFTALSGGSQVPADQQIPAGIGGLDERVSLDLRNIEVSDALRFIAQKGGLNLAVSKNVQGRVQLLLNNVPVGDILDIILITNQLAYEKRGDIYYIMTEAEFKERFGRKFSDTRKVKIFRLKYAIPDQAFALFEVLKSEIGRLLVDPETGTVLVMDAQENIDRMQMALAGLEQKRTVKIYALKYAKATDVESRLKSQLDSKKVGLVSADERTNSVIVETLSARLEDIDRLVEALDVKTKEVLIDAKIVKVSINDDNHAEIKWDGLEAALGKYGTQFVSNHPWSALFRNNQSYVDNFAQIPPTATPPAGQMSTLTQNLFLGLVDQSDAFEVMINFLKTLGETKVLSNPKLAVVNNQEAKIHVGQKQAYVTTTTTTGQTTTTTAEAVTFVDVGIQLSVTPTINDDGFVSMKIKPEVSSVVDTLVTPSGNKIPIIDSSLAETSVMVKDGTSIIIGGLRKDEEDNTRNSVPILGDIPIIGAPFNSTVKTKIHTELLILITPHIVYGDKFVAGPRMAVDKPYMSYTDYDAANPVAHKGAVKVASPVRT